MPPAGFDPTIPASELPQAHATGFGKVLLECEIKPKRILFSVISEYRAVYEMMWRNVVQAGRSQRTIWYGAEEMRFACRVT